MDVLLGVDFAVAEKDRLYRCLDRILEHRKDLFQHLQGRWKTLFDVQFDVLLYDLTSTYVEGAAELNRKAKRGYSRAGRAGGLHESQASAGGDCGVIHTGLRSNGRYPFGQDLAERISEADPRNLRRS